jgi:hypothetical protein
MELRKENSAEKRRRRISVSRPVLVRSVKQGQVLSATYARETSSFSSQIWKA